MKLKLKLKHLAVISLFSVTIPSVFADQWDNDNSYERNEDRNENRSENRYDTRYDNDHDIDYQDDSYDRRTDHWDHESDNDWDRGGHGGGYGRGHDRGEGRDRNHRRGEQASCRTALVNSRGESIRYFQEFGFGYTYQAARDEACYKAIDSCRFTKRDLERRFPRLTCRVLR